MTRSTEEIQAEIDRVVNGVDRSRNPTVVEYAVQNLFKRQSPKKASENTAKSLSGSPNMFMGVHPPNVVSIDPSQLEEALWGRIVDNTIKAMASLRPAIGT